MARTIRLRNGQRLWVVAGGIENDRQLQFLRSIGGHRPQGFLFNRPLPAEQIPPLLKQPLIH